jgi:RNAse (barnase) inhibitor barstar
MVEPEVGFQTRVNVSPIVLMEPNAAEDFIFKLQRNPEGGIVRVIRGKKCGDELSLHSEIGAALQFPSYYGENWDAFVDCMRDYWPQGAWSLVHLADVEQVWNVGMFILVMRRVVHEFNQQGWPFNVIVSGTPAGLARVELALRSPYRRP